VRSTARAISPADVLLLLAAFTFAVGIAGAAIAFVFAIYRKKPGISSTSSKLNADDRRFLDCFLVSRVSTMTIVYSIALAIVFGLIWVLSK
jgi:hypothetical protein